MARDKCPALAECQLFKEADLISVLKHNIQTFYCNRNYEKCARYILCRQGLPVPANLLPNNKTCIQCEIKSDTSCTACEIESE